MDPAAVVRRAKTKKRKRHDIETDHLKLYSYLRSEGLEGLLVDSAVWLCVDSQTTHVLDCLCLGNLDGGPMMARHVATVLASSSNASENRAAEGMKSVRLSLEEAFFLQYVLKFLKVSESMENGDRVVPLDNSAFWQRCRTLRKDFVVSYAAYHHFRSKGWIPRTGLQYGVDLVIYQRHPAIAHSDYSVLVHPLGENVLCEFGRPALSWHDVQVTNRLTTQVGKRLLLLYIEILEDTKLESPDCIFKMKVEERLVRRWVPERM